ncbi:MAG: hypothetical protein U0793_21660 [Gemmataceae bacterium]
MNTRQALVFAIALLLGCFVGGSFLSQPSTAQGPGGAMPGRYQLSGNGAVSILVLDTATGQVWTTGNASIGRWTDMGSPVRK